MTTGSRGIMALHTVDTDELAALARTLDDFSAYLTTFESQTMSHGNALLSAWSGQASAEFISELMTWAVGARLLITRAQNMATWAHSAEGSYVSAVDAAKEVTAS
jgi:uncharacterized protein YukE